MRKVELNDKQIGVILLFVERYEGTKTQIRVMDQAMNALDPDFEISGMMEPTDQGIRLPIDDLGEKTKICEIKDTPYKQLQGFLKDQSVPYSRRPDSIGRIFLTVLTALEKAEYVDEEDE